MTIQSAQLAGFTVTQKLKIGERKGLDRVGALIFHQPPGTRFRRARFRPPDSPEIGGRRHQG
jgi:hypothetical protein